MTDPVDTVAFIETVARLEAGDEVWMATNAAEWSDPLTTRTACVIEWDCPGGSWLTAEAIVATDRTEYPLRAVQGTRTPVLERYEYPQHVIVFDPVTEFEPVVWEDWSAPAGAEAAVKCRGCGSHVRKDYARVFAPDGTDRPRCCPNCEDLIRDGDGTIRKKRPGHRGRKTA